MGYHRSGRVRVVLTGYDRGSLGTLEGGGVPSTESISEDCGTKV